MEISPVPWTVKPRERHPEVGNIPSELVDANGDWVANFDGHEEQEFAAAANPAAVIALLDDNARLREALRDAVLSLEAVSEVMALKGQSGMASQISEFSAIARQALTHHPERK